MGNMKKTIIAMAFLMVVGAPAAMAQGTNSGSSMSKSGGGVPQAPIGHRQPRLSDLPPETMEAERPKVDPADAARDRKIRSICRGC